MSRDIPIENLYYLLCYAYDKLPDNAITRGDSENCPNSENLLALALARGIKNLQRTLVVKCRTTRNCEEWRQHLENLQEQAKGFLHATASRFNSFAPIREKQLAYS